MTPQLRFPEFTDEWQVKKLGDIADGKLSNGVFNDPNKVGSGYKLINVKDMYVDGFIDEATLTKVAIDKTEFQRNKVKNGDLFFTRSSLVKEGIAYTNIYLKRSDDITFDGHLIKLSPRKDQFIPEFLYYLSKTNSARRQLVTFGTTTTMTTIGQKEVSEVEVRTPSKPEQEKIADFLTAVDERIAVGEKKLELLETYKRGVMQKIFSQQVRFKDENGSSYPDWEQKKLGEILKEVNEKTEKSNKFETLSSTTKGLFSQKDYFSKNIASDDNTGYKVLRINQIVLSPQNLWMGNINFNDKFEAGIVSPSYKIFETVRAVSGYLRHILKTRRMLYEYTQASEQGASIVRRNLDISSFMAISVTIPTVQEQQKIADFLTTLDEKIAAEKSKLTAVRQFKKALLQRMFV